MSDLMRWNPFYELQSFRNEMNKLFSDSLSRLQVNAAEDTNTFAPAVNIYQNEKSFFVELEMPGLKPEDIAINLTRDSLKISGQMCHEETAEERTYIRRERRSGYFTRTFSLSDDVNTEQAEASYQNGILKIVIPKAEPARSRTLEIKSE